jgi:hypothetical protein
MIFRTNRQKYYRMPSTPKLIGGRRGYSFCEMLDRETIEMFVDALNRYAHRWHENDIAAEDKRVDPEYHSRGILGVDVSIFQYKNTHYSHDRYTENEEEKWTVNLVFRNNQSVDLYSGNIEEKLIKYEQIKYAYIQTAVDNMQSFRNWLLLEKLTFGGNI